VAEQPVATVDGEAWIAGVVVLGASRWIVLDQGEERVLVEAETERSIRLRVPSTTSMDWGATPCP
jgi:hypothetical protein